MGAHNREQKRSKGLTLGLLCGAVAAMGLSALNPYGAFGEGSGAEYVGYVDYDTGDLSVEVAPHWIVTTIEGVTVIDALHPSISPQEQAAFRQAFVEWDANNVVVIDDDGNIVSVATE